MQKLLIFSILVVFFMSVGLLAGCSGGSDRPVTVGAVTHASRSAAVAAILAEDSVSRWEPLTLEMPDECIKLKVNHVGHYREVFNDSNHVHWAEAERVGIEPIRDTRGHWMTRHPLEKIASCADFYVDEMRYSSPYLVPRAARMVHEIGRRFRDTLRARGGGDYRIKVTSVLRTPRSVRQLQRVNRNSVDSSTHMLGTTVDISYARFICDDPSIPRSADDLKGVLAEVLYDMRREGWCYVKYENKQPCFHISCRDYDPETIYKKQKK